MSIPLYFNAWKFSNNLPNNHLFVDGGLVYNYPISAFDLGNQINWETLGFRLEDLHGINTPTNFGYGHWLDYVKNTFETLLKSQDIEFKRDLEQIKRSVIINDWGVLATDFNISRQMKEKLITSGKKATEQYLNALTSTLRL